MNGGRGVRTSGGHLPAIDGLRALAVAAVLLFHLGIRWASGGFLGVSLFFTISGFIITTLLLREHETAGRIRLRAFWERRYRRLMPAALVTIAGIALASPHLADATQRAHVRGDLLATLGYVANWRFLARGTRYADLFGAPSPVLHFWSLAIEEQFYIVFPLIVAAVLSVRHGSRRALATTLGVLAAASVVWQISLHNVDRVYLGTDTRAAELLAGALLAIALARPARPSSRRWSIVGVAGLVLFLALVATSTARASWLGDGGLALVALVNVTLVGSAARDARALRFLATRPLVAVGRVSYGIYLFHWPVFIWLDERRTGLHGVPLAFVRLAVVAAITVASYHVLECPVRYGRVIRRARTFVPAAIAALVVSFVVAASAPVSHTTDHLLNVRAMPSTAQQFAAQRAPAATGHLRVMVVGNELGRLAAWALATLPGHPFVVDNATRPRCPLLMVAYTRLYRADPPFFAGACHDWPYRWVDEARAFHPDVVLVFSTAETDEMGATDKTFVDVGLSPLYQQTIDTYADAASLLRSTGAVVAWATLPRPQPVGPPGVVGGTSVRGRATLINNAIAIVAQRELGVVELDFASHVEHPPKDHLKEWFAGEVWRAYRAARQELGLPSKGSHHALRVLVTGDSTSLNIAAGLANHGLAHNDIVVDWAGQIACPLVRVARFRELGQDQSFDTSRCTPFDQLWPQHFAMFKPDVVLVVSSFMDAADLERAGSGSWEHLGQPAFDDFVAHEFDSAYALARHSGARVAWATAPLEDTAQPGATPALRQRLHRYNELLLSLLLRHHDIAMMPLAQRVDSPDGVVDLEQRPDGVHFTIAAGRAIADAWLASALEQLKRV